MRRRLFALLAFALLLAPLAVPGPALAAPAVTVTPAAGPAGTPFVVRGSGFDVTGTESSPGQILVWVQAAGNSSILEDAEGRVGADGRFEVTLPSARLAPGAYVLTIVYNRQRPYPQTSLEQAATITITGPASPATGVPSLAVSPSAIPFGARFTITGSGYQTGKRYYLYIAAYRFAFEIITVTDGAGSLRVSVGATEKEGNIAFDADGSYGFDVFSKMPSGIYPISIYDGPNGGKELATTQVAIGTGAAPPPPAPAPSPGPGPTPPPAPAPGDIPPALQGPPLAFPPGTTPFSVAGAFRVQWETHGGLAINGYPLSEVFLQRLEDGTSYWVQYFERVRIEYHPEVADPQYQVQLGQFGRRLHPLDPPAAPQPGAAYFPETEHTLGGGFLAYWQANGQLAQFGFPLSEVFTETLEDGNAYQVQYFERARFEYHGTTVLLGQFGRRVLAETPR